MMIWHQHEAALVLSKYLIVSKFIVGKKIVENDAGKINENLQKSSV
jgi:hypothetical protein